MPIVINGTTGISGVDGSAGTPSYQGGDTNTGVFFPATDVIAFSTNGNEDARFDSSGNFLIGTTTTGSTGITLPNTYNIGWGQGAGESVPNIFRQASSAATVMANGYRYTTTANGFASSFSSSYAKSAISCGTVAGGITFYTDTAATVAAGTDVTPTERMRIDSSGNVAIGTTSASGRLTVASTGTAIDCPLTNGSITLREAGGSSANNTVELHIRPAAGRSGYLSFTENAVADRWSIGIQNGVDALRFMNGSPTGGTERMRITSGGSVSIGTTNSFATLTVNGNITPSAAPNTNWGIDFAPTTASGAFVTIANDGLYDLASGSGLVYVYDNAGNGIGQLFAFYGSTSVTNISGGLYAGVINTAGKVNFYYESGVARYRFQNRTGGTVNLFISTIRLRASV